MTTKIFNIKSALTARIIYKNISLFLNRLDKSNSLPPAGRSHIKIVVKFSYKTGGGALKLDLLVLVLFHT